MDEDAMIVTLTKRQLKELIIETLTQCFDGVVANPKILSSDDIEIRKLSDLEKLYKISIATASKWKRAMSDDGALSQIGGNWWTTKSRVDRWIESKNYTNNNQYDNN